LGPRRPFGLPPTRFPYFRSTSAHALGGSLSSNYARQTLPAFPAEVFADSGLRALRSLYAEHADAFDKCRATDAAVEDAVASLRRSRERYDDDGERSARAHYDEARVDNSRARRHLADLHARALAEVAAKRDTIRPLIAEALAAAHSDALAAVDRAKSADHRQRAAVASLRALDAVTARRRPGVDPLDIDLVTNAVAVAYDSVQNLHDPSAPRRRNVALSWRDVTESVAGVPVAQLVALNALSADALAPVLADAGRRQTARAARI
jgi:hypothetical protein